MGFRVCVRNGFRATGWDEAPQNPAPEGRPILAQRFQRWEKWEEGSKSRRDDPSSHAHSLAPVSLLCVYDDFFRSLLEACVVTGLCPVQRGEAPLPRRRFICEVSRDPLEVIAICPEGLRYRGILLLDARNENWQIASGR